MNSRDIKNAKIKSNLAPLRHGIGYPLGSALNNNTYFYDPSFRTLQGIFITIRLILNLKVSFEILHQES